MWVTAWGGPNTLAQALHKIKATRSPADAALLIGKLRVYTISDQDDTGNWMRRTFPDLFYIVSPGGYGAATWIGINWVAPGIDNSTISNRWLAEHIQQGHGPLGAIYPDVAYGMEGDTPSWLSLVPNGLNAPERPNWGGWGGRYDLYRPDVAEFDPKGFNGGVPVEPEPRAIWTNAVDEYAPITSNDHKRAHTLGGSALKDFKATIVRWRDDFQNDFAARMDWTVKPRAEANHPPAPRLRHPAEISVRSGERFELDARGTTDPDGDSLSFFWFQYPEAGTSKAQFQNLECAQHGPRRCHRSDGDTGRDDTLHFESDGQRASTAVEVSAGRRDCQPVGTPQTASGSVLSTQGWTQRRTLQIVACHVGSEYTHVAMQGPSAFPAIGECPDYCLWRADHDAGARWGKLRSGSKARVLGVHSDGRVRARRYSTRAAA